VTASPPSPPADRDDIRPGHVLVVPPGTDPAHPTGYLLHATHIAALEDCARVFVRGYVLNAAGVHRRDRHMGERMLWVPLAALRAKTVEVAIGADRMRVPWVVAAGQRRAVPLLDVMPLHDAIAIFGTCYPATGAYGAPHAHRHDECGHLLHCPFAELRRPCQQIECHSGTCVDCDLLATGREDLAS
jgi:hypothetical protein